MRRVTWVIVAFAAVYIATFIAFQWQCYRLNAKCEEAMQKARDADAMAKLIVLDHKMYWRYIYVFTEGDILQKMGMIDSVQSYRLYDQLIDMYDSIENKGILYGKVNGWSGTREFLWQDLVDHEAQD